MDDRDGYDIMRQCEGKKIKFLSTLTESSIKEFFKLQIDTDADLWLIEVVSKDFDLHDLFLKQGL